MSNNYSTVHSSSTFDLFLSDRSTSTYFSIVLGVIFLIFYLFLVRHLRYKNLEYIINKYPDPNEILKDSKAASEVISITGLHEFSFSYEHALLVALLKTNTKPEGTKLLCATGQMTKAIFRRYEDTDLLLRELFEIHARIENQLKKNPQTPQRDIDSQYQRRTMAIQRINQMHEKYNIKNDDLLYVLTMFITEPYFWINKYEWRELDQREINVDMNIKNIPDSFEKLLEFKESFAKDNCRYSKTNWQCGEPSLRLFISWIPGSSLIFGLACQVLSSFMNPRDAAAFGLPKENAFYTKLIYGVLRCRAFLIRHLFLPRTYFTTRTAFYPNAQGRYVPNYFMYNNYVYQDGYDVSNLGPEKFSNTNGKSACPFA
ncbi:hypothetical protein BY458DRAFT_438873 [Sporodiniella umbellata]|nr:hypothetical protein BY458DRAFT_438873 [Sporodiniella umbellata]